MLNKIIIQGRLTRDPELRRTGSGLAVTSFCVACERDFPNTNTGERDVDFIECVAWREKGEFVNKWFTKGAMIVVSGRLQMRNWTDKNGNKRVTAEILVDNTYFGESKKDRDARENAGVGGPPNYSNYGGYYPGPYVTPSGSDFTMLDDDDGAVLPF